MSYEFKPLSPEEFTVNDYRVYKDGNGIWIANPPIESIELQKAVNGYINAKEKKVQSPERTVKSCGGRWFRKLRGRTGKMQ